MTSSNPYSDVASTGSHSNTTHKKRRNIFARLRPHQHHHDRGQTSSSAASVNGHTTAGRSTSTTVVVGNRRRAATTSSSPTNRRNNDGGGGGGGVAATKASIRGRATRRGTSSAEAVRMAPGRWETTTKTTLSPKATSSLRKRSKNGSRNPSAPQQQQQQQLQVTIQDVGSGVNNSDMNRAVIHHNKSQNDNNKSNTTTISSSGSAGWLSHSKYFRQMTDWAFDVVDTDQSGEVDEKELYSGLLLIHLKIGSYAGPAACKPVSRERVHAIFHKMDADHSGHLDRVEFRQVMTVLCSNVLTRVMAQWSLTLLIVPLVAQFLLDGMAWVWIWSMQQVMGAAAESRVMLLLADSLSDLVTDMLQWMQDTMMPASSSSSWIQSFLLSMYHSIANLLAQIPESVWETIPLTLLSCILGCIAVPYTIFKIDEFFQGMADRRSTTSTATTTRTTASTGTTMNGHSNGNDPSSSWSRENETSSRVSV